MRHADGERLRFSYRPRGPFDLDRTAARFVRFPEAVDRFEDGVYRRLMPAGSGVALVAVRRSGSGRTAPLRVDVQFRGVTRPGAGGGAHGGRARSRRGRGRSALRPRPGPRPLAGRAAAALPRAAHRRDGIAVGVAGDGGPVPAAIWPSPIPSAAIWPWRLETGDWRLETKVAAASPELSCDVSSLSHQSPVASRQSPVARLQSITPAPPPAGAVRRSIPPRRGSRKPRTD